MVIFTKWILQIKGCGDAKKNAAEKSDLIDKYYYTPYIGIVISKFISIAKSKLTKIRKKITALNKSIKNFNYECDACFKKVSAEISAVKEEIAIVDGLPDNPQNRTRKNILNSKIKELEKTAIIKIQEINKKGKKDEYDARKLVENYHSWFNEGLGNCRSRLKVYWEALYLKNKEMETGIIINGHLPTGEELIIMSNDTNPAIGIDITPYVDISPADIEMIKYK